MAFIASSSYIPSRDRKNLTDLAISGETLHRLMQDVLATGAAFQFRAKGYSMTPFIKDGNLITVAPASKVKPSLGKVVAFIHPATAQLVIHRVISRQGSGFLIRADNIARQPDGLVPAHSILGVVTRIQRGQRRFTFGLGPERYLLALLSRIGYLNPLLKILRTTKNIFLT